MKISNKDVYDFIQKVNYKKGDNDMPINIIVDHVNKIYNPNSNVIAVMIEIIFFLLPPSIYNMVKISLKNQYNLNMSIRNIVEKILDINIDITTNYRHSDIFTILHPWIARHLRNSFKNVMEILLSKVFDNKDNYFNKISNTSPIKILHNSTNDEIKLFQTMYNLDAVLTGSNALSFYGNVYRDKIKDYDFILLLDKLGDILKEYVVNEITNNNIVNKHRSEIENKLKELFFSCELGVELKSILGSDLKLIGCNIDRTSQYDFENKVTFIFDYKGIEFDLLFKENVEYNTILDKEHNISINVQNIEGIIQSKRLLSRHKDFQDLINFKPFKRYTTTNECKIVYE